MDQFYEGYGPSRGKAIRKAVELAYCDLVRERPPRDHDEYAVHYRVAFRVISVEGEATGSGPWGPPKYCEYCAKIEVTAVDATRDGRPWEP